MINYSYGSVPEWLKGADCKSAAYATLVRIQPGPRKKHKTFCNNFINQSYLQSQSIKQEVLE